MSTKKSTKNGNPTSTISIFMRKKEDGVVWVISDRQVRYGRPPLFDTVFKEVDSEQ